MIEMFKHILITHKGENGILKSFIKVLVRESVVSKIVDLLISSKELGLCKKACELLNATFEICREINLIAELQQSVLSHLAQGSNYSELLKNVRKTLIKCIKKLNKKYMPEKAKVYDANLSLVNAIPKAKKTELFSYVRTLLLFLSELYGNSFKLITNSTSSIAAHQLQHDPTTSALSTALGRLLISLAESTLFPRPAATLLPPLFAVLTHVSAASHSSRMRLAVWTAFVRTLNWFVAGPELWTGEGEGELVKQEALFCAVGVRLPLSLAD